MIGRIDPVRSYVYFDELENVKPGEQYVDENNEIQIRGLEEEE